MKKQNVLWQLVVVFVPPKLRQLLTDLFNQPLSTTIKKGLAWLGNLFKQLAALPYRMVKHLLSVLGWKAEENTKTPNEKAQELQEQVAATYSNIRYGLALISFLFPLWLWRIGQWWYDLPLLGSMSAYYWQTSNADGPVRSWIKSRDILFLNEVLSLPFIGGEAPMRSWFVGILFLLGIFLYLYKGFRTGENYLLNIAGISAVGVALFPMSWECAQAPLCPNYGTLHAVFAVTTFACIGLVAWLYAQYTLDLIPLAEEEKTEAYRWWYRIITIAFVGLILVAIIPSPFKRNPNRIFYLEWGGIWILAVYWWIKSNELSEKRQAATQAEQLETRVIQQDTRMLDNLAAQSLIGDRRSNQVAKRAS
jgi:hypothetical protein